MLAVVQDEQQLVACQGVGERPCERDPPRSRIPTAAATALATMLGSRRSDHATVGLNARFPTCRARRVLPTPPGPTSVSSLALLSR